MRRILTLGQTRRVNNVAAVVAGDGDTQVEKYRRKRNEMTQLNRPFSVQINSLLVDGQQFDTSGTSSLHYLFGFVGCVCACPFMRVFMHVWVCALRLPWTAWKMVPLITFIFSCNLKAITISLGVRKSVNMVHLFDRQGRTDKSSSAASISNCY